MTSSVPTPWRCPRCDADRAAEDTFCGRCGARRPDPEREAGASSGTEGSGGGRPRGFPVARALVLNGVVLVAVVIAVVLGSGGGPTAIAFDPPTWRCDGSPRAWIATVPPAHLDLRIEWRAGGRAGTVLLTETITRADLEPYPAADGTVRVATDDTGAPECSLEPGTYTLTVRDEASGALVAAGDVTLEP